MQVANRLASCVFEQKWKQAVQKACATRFAHAPTKTGRDTQMLEIRFANRLRMIGEQMSQWNLAFLYFHPSVYLKRQRKGFQISSQFVILVKYFSILMGLSKMDSIDQRLLALLQDNSSYTVAEISEKIGISSTPVWKRMKRLEESGVIANRVVLLDPQKIGLGLTGFVLVRTNNHSEEWLKRFANVVDSVPEIVEMHRMAGDVDYLLKIVAPDVSGYDAIYKKIIKDIELSDVSASFSMEVVKSTTVLPLDYAA